MVPEAAGKRFICVGESVSMIDYALWLKESFPKGFKIPTGKMGKWLFWIVTCFDSEAA